MKVFIIAGEPSGDALGQAVMSGLKTLAPDVSFQGIGGPLMESEGLTSQFPMSELSLMGLVEILPKYFHLKRRIAETVDAVVASGADVLLTIDSPDFCLRVAKAVRARSRIKTVHYVAPSVWAWRPGRAEKMAGFIDHVLALLPFEPPYMTKAGMGCDFVGHPIAAWPKVQAEAVAAFRARHEVDEPLLLVLPGSRRGEVSRLLPIFGEVVRRLDGVRLVIGVAANVAEPVQTAVADWPGDPILINPGAEDKQTAFAAADAALAASGTVSLELAAVGTPMVIAYDMAWLTRQIMQRMLLTDTVTLVNLVTETRAVPEFIGAACRAELIVPAVQQLLDAPDRQKAALDLTMERLGRGGKAPGLRAAHALLKATG